MTNDVSMTATVRLTGRVALWSRDERSRPRLAMLIAQNGFEVVDFASLEQLRVGLAGGQFVACVLDEPPSIDLVRALEQAARAANKPTQFLVLPSLGMRGISTAGFGGEILEPPFTPEKLGRALFAAVGRSRLIAENLQLKRQLEGRMFDDLAGHSPAMDEVRRLVLQAAEHDRTVLVIGEPGSGTTSVARAVHLTRHGGRRPFLKIHCGVLSSAVIEHELFGGPNVSGRFSSAAGGTLLLEDIDSLAFPMQERIAHVLSDREFRPFGVESSLPLNVRIVATSHLAPRELSSSARLLPPLWDILRHDLIPVPALRDRREDIGELTEHFLEEAGFREGKPIRRLSGDALERLKAHNWAGNIRELGNVISRCCSIAGATEINRDHIEPWLSATATDMPADDPGLTLEEMERKLIEATFNRFGGNRELTAKALKIGLRTLSGKLREYGYPPRGGPGSNRQTRVA